MGAREGTLRQLTVAAPHDARGIPVVPHVAAERPLRFGLLYLQSPPWGDPLGRIRRGEEMGFDSLWVGDHQAGQYPGLVSFGAWTLLATMGVTTRPSFQLAGILLIFTGMVLMHFEGQRQPTGYGVARAHAHSEAQARTTWPQCPRRGTEST